MQFTARVSQVQSIDKEPPPNTTEAPPVVSKVTLLANVHDDANKAAWGGVIPSAGIEIGHLFGDASKQFCLGKNYRVTIEPIN
jgi:hypothetical protein